MTPRQGASSFCSGVELKHDNRPTTVTTLLFRAKLAIETGDASLRTAAEFIAAAREQGATQRKIAHAVGKSPAWVNRLIRWRDAGCIGSPFGPQAKASRQRAERVQSSKLKDLNAATSHEPAQAPAARAQADADKADAAKVKDDAEALSTNAKDSRHSFFEFGSNTVESVIRRHERDLLVKSLGMLGSDQAGERANAALIVENVRKQIGLLWQDLIIKAQ